MFETPNVMRLAQELARHSGARQSQIAKNIANSDTPGYRARDLESFSETYQQQRPTVDVRATREGHLLAGATRASWETVDVGGETSPNGNTVSLEQEMVRGTDAKSAHDMALTVYSTSLDILRTALGRGR